MSAGESITYVAQSPAQADAVLEVRSSMLRTGHSSVHVEAPAEWDELQGGVYVTGYKPAALDRCAFVAADGKVTWLR